MGAPKRAVIHVSIAMMLFDALDVDQEISEGIVRPLLHQEEIVDELSI
jgi:hypothetical protein